MADDTGHLFAKCKFLENGAKLYDDYKSDRATGMLDRSTLSRRRRMNTDLRTTRNEIKRVVDVCDRKILGCLTAPLGFDAEKKARYVALHELRQGLIGASAASSRFAWLVRR